MRIVSLSVAGQHLSIYRAVTLTSPIGAQCKCKCKRLFFVLLFPVNSSGDCQISSVGNFLPRIYAGGVEGLVDEVKSFSWGGAQTKGEVHKRELTNKMFLGSDLLTSLTSYLTPLFLRL